MKKIFMFIVTAIIFSSLGFAKSNPIMKVQDTSGKTYTVEGTSNGLIINELKNKIVFVEFFGHNCPPCLKTIPHLKTLQAKYKDRLAIVAIEVQGFSSSELKSFATKNQINYITISQDKGDILVNYIASRAKWSGSIPFLTVVDKKGSVQLLQAGLLPYETLEQTVLKLSK
jgi:thiol-disulfide isomerase/thioredoxin